MVKLTIGKFQQEYLNFMDIFLENEGKVLHYRYKDKYVKLYHQDKQWRWKGNIYLDGLKPFQSFDEAYQYIEKTIS